MIFKLHYWFLASGINAIGFLLGAFMQTYTDASILEVGLLLMLMPFSGLIFRPIICSMADRAQAHKKYIMACLAVTSISYSPYLIIPFAGPQLYQVHPRTCWYILLIAKIMGDISLGGVISIGDSLAINYAKRINTEFSVYRVWGTLSWMTFGLIIGQINEISFLPRYTPAFIVLISSSLLNMFFIWLWPDEYFKMVPHNPADDAKIIYGDGKKVSKHTKSLLPRQVVQAHMRAKILGIFTICYRKSKDVEAYETAVASEIATKSNGTKGIDLALGKPADERQAIEKSVQVRILWLLIRRDPRILMYCFVFMTTGLFMAALSFFTMSLSPICHEQGTCDYSSLVGMLQASMAAAESILFMYVGKVQRVIGRLNLAAVALLAFSIRYLFYGTYFTQVSPYYSLVGEMLQGVSYGATLTLMVEMAHLFANEVEYVLPELVQMGVVEAGADAEPLKLSLGATMQAFISGFNDGIGKGVGALVYGFMLEHMSYTSLWFIIGCCASASLILVVTANILDKVFQFNLGLDVKAKQNKCIESSKANSAAC